MFRYVTQTATVSRISLPGCAAICRTRRVLYDLSELFRVFGDPKAREMLNFDRNKSEWVLTMPDGNKMAYGTAVRMGIIRV